MLAGYGWAQQVHDETTARAFAFVALVASNLALILSNRSSRSGVWASLRRPNPTLWAVVGLACALLLAVTEWAPAAHLLRLAPLPPAVLAAAFGLGLSSLLWFEGIKALQRWRTRLTPARHGPFTAGI